MAPHQGTLIPAVIPGLRRVRKDRAIINFLVDKEVQSVRILAIFFGGQDHQNHMLQRLVGQQE